MTTRDMTAPNWARTVKRLRRYGEEMKKEGVIVFFPPDFDTPPAHRKPAIDLPHDPLL